MSLFTCHCGATVENGINPKDGCYNVGQIERRTGWFQVILEGCDCIWICPACMKKALEFMGQLIDLLGTSDVYFGQLARMVRQREQVNERDDQSRPDRE